jgi:hypothetical protein
MHSGPIPGTGLLTSIAAPYSLAGSVGWAWPFLKIQSRLGSQKPRAGPFSNITRNRGMLSMSSEGG